MTTGRKPLSAWRSSKISPVRHRWIFGPIVFCETPAATSPKEDSVSSVLPKVSLSDGRSEVGTATVLHTFADDEDDLPQMTMFCKVEEWANGHESVTGFQRWLRRWVVAVLVGFKVGEILATKKASALRGRTLLDQLVSVGPASLLVASLTACFAGGVFTIQVAREFITFKVSRAIGAVMGLALVRELIPVLTAVIVAGRVGSAFAAEIGTMSVSEQVDALIMLRTDPLEYLVLPRVVATCVMLPILSLVCLLTGLATCVAISYNFYNIDPYTILYNARRALTLVDLTYMLIKAVVFGAMISVIGCSWGLTTTGGAKGVGTSTTSSVVTSLMSIFLGNFVLSGLMFNGLGSALKNIL